MKHRAPRDGSTTMATVRVQRTAKLPDPERVERCRRLPEFGPRILFFSGGTALRGLSRRLKLYTENSSHLITPFDSGGSSALLRQTFGMPSVGDLRNRLMALADESARGNPEIYELFSFRFPRQSEREALSRELHQMVLGEHALVAAVPGPLRRLIRTHLRMFVELAPAAFDLRGASIGNLILAGGYLHNERDLDSVLFLFSQLVEVLGRVALSSEANLHLSANLADGTTIVGQHRLTGKETEPIASRVVDLSLVSALDRPEPAAADASSRALTLIERAELVCFPMGSLYSSIIANLLPRGIGKAVARSGAPKVLVPSTGVDPEQVAMGPADALDEVFRYVRRDAGADVPASSIVDLVLLDVDDANYPVAPDVARMRRAGVEVVRLPLVEPGSAPRIAAQPLVDALLSIA